MASTIFVGSENSGGPFTGQMTGPAGDNTAAPPFTFSGDTSSGVASSAVGTTNIMSGGTSRVSVSASALTSTVPYVGTNLTASAAGVLNWTGRSRLSSSADALLEFLNSAATSGIGLDVSTDGTLKIRNRSQTAATGSLDLGGKITAYNGVATAGIGIPSVVGYARTVGAVAAVASVATYTVGASDGTFEISANVNVTTATLHNFTVTCAYTNENNVSQTVTLGFVQLSGATLITAITNVTGANSYESPIYHIRAKSGTSITIASTAGGTYTTIVYNIEGTIKQVA